MLEYHTTVTWSYKSEIGLWVHSASVIVAAFPHPRARLLLDVMGSLVMQWGSQLACQQPCWQQAEASETGATYWCWEGMNLSPDGLNPWLQQQVCTRLDLQSETNKQKKPNVFRRLRNVRQWRRRPGPFFPHSQGTLGDRSHSRKTSSSQRNTASYSSLAEPGSAAPGLKQRFTLRLWAPEMAGNTY